MYKNNAKKKKKGFANEHMYIRRKIQMSITNGRS